MDREKVIEAFADYEPYSHDLPCVTIKSKVYRDALALMKEQEAVEPIITPYKTDDDGEVVVTKKQCGNCGWMFFTMKPNFCENCGRPVKWKENIWNYE